MATEFQRTPTLSIDFRRGRIRIHKKTLRLLGSPDFLQLLINPQDQVIAVQRLESGVGQFIKVDWEGLGRRNCLEIHSTYFLDKLRSCCISWPQDRTYRIDGKYIHAYEIARFCLKDAQPVNSEVETENG